ncbi:DUF3231 family protein [Ruminiclostridium cellobioparum]|uniref:DUF3231 family protein n=1 Tax=Ruminiclostridium cellobioparum subsp. termitidis CT1112 TaxID=1195236 RepID=S0FV21_RUMCE|nr:DUF3231 family protein [Ruminiclostridium cellobioparum]EMS73009.1 Protein of unknown function (DUF3231) [Ruminiclostridium cellobioparum subsp. termitidis CT1112]
MQDKTRLDILSSEVSGLWSTYMYDSLAICVLEHFIKTLNDTEIHFILKYAEDMSREHINLISGIFEKDGLTVPEGFTREDVDLDAPKLFTDPFYLFYLLNMGMIGMNNYTLILNHSSRIDIRNFFSSCIRESVELYNMTVDTLQKQGLFIKSPRIEFTKNIDFIDTQDFFAGGWFAQKRNLLAQEITTIFANLRFNKVGGDLIAAFGQVAGSAKLKDYFFKGRELATKKTKKLVEFFTDENIPVPSTFDSFVTDSTVSPFSDKLMLFHIVTLIGSSIIQDGAGLATAMRHDLQLHFSASAMDSAKYSEDGLDILIENRWLEQPPQHINHKRLT